MSASAIRAGQAYVELTTRNGTLNKGMEAAQKKLRSVAAVAGQIGKQTASGLGRAQSVLQSFSGSVLNLKSVIASSIVVVGLKSAVSQFTDAGKQMVEAMKITGMSAEQLNRIGFGSWISTQDVAAAFRLNAAIGVLGDSFAAIQNVIGGALAPMLTEVIYRITRAANSVRRWIDSNRSAIVVIAQVAAGVGFAGGALLALAGTAAIVSTAIGAVVGVVGWLSAAFGVAASAIAFILSPIGLVIAGVAALGAAILYYTGAGSVALQWLSDTFKWVYDTVKPILGAIIEALMSGQWAKAGKIMMASIEMAIRVGSKPLYAFWLDTINKLQDAWEKGKMALANTWTNLMVAMGEPFQKFLNGAIQMWDDAVTSITKNMLYVQSLLPSAVGGISKDVYEQKSKEITDEANKRKEERDDNIVTEEKAKELIAKRLSEYESDKAKRDAEVNKNKGSFDARINELRQSIGSAMADVRKTVDLQNKANMPERMRLPQLQDLAALTKGITSVGTSSGFAADRLGAGNEANTIAGLIREMKNNTLVTRENNALLKKKETDYGLLGP